MPKANGPNPVTLSPPVWNRVDEATEYYLQQARMGQAGGSPQLLVFPTDIIQVKNFTGADLARGSVVEISSYLLTGLTVYEPTKLWFNGITPSTPPSSNFGILCQAIKNNKINDCQVSGRCVARVNILNKSHICAVPKAGQSYLESSMIGPVRIAHKSGTGTGEMECAVLLGQPIVPLLGVTTDAIGRTADATVTLVKRTATGYTTWRDIDSAAMTIETRCFFLNVADTIPASRAVRVGMVEGFFPEIENAWCADKDFDLEG